MKLKWRSDTYEFLQKKFRVGPDKETRNVNVNAPIFAFDTESSMCGDRYEPICFQLSGPDPWGENLSYIPPRGNALQIFLESFINIHGERVMNQHVFMYGHNLIYDWLQLVKNYPDLIAMVKTGVGLPHDYELFKTDEFTAVLKKDGLFTGNAPFFSIDIKISHRKHLLIMFRDTFSFFPASLKSLGKELKLNEFKRDRPDDIGIIDYRTLADTNPAKIEFETYAKIDARVTRLVAERIRELHIQGELLKIRVSAPSYAISLLFRHQNPDCVILNGSGEEHIMQLVVDAYSGGRSGGIFHGKVEHVTVLDIHSSYPTSMSLLPSFTADMHYYDFPNPEALTETELLEILNEYHAFLDIDGTETDSRYPALLTSNGKKLIPVCGDFYGIRTTGTEVFAGIKSGTLHISRVNKLVALLDDNAPYLPFKTFAEAAYNRKQNAEKGSPEYTSAKLVLNASYGKLIESHNNIFIDTEYKNVMLPYIPDMRKHFAEMYYEAYINCKRDNTDFDKQLDFLLESLYQQFNPELFQHTTFEFLSLNDLHYGRFAIPAAAALITGISRARLLVGMKLLYALYWDTDSIFTTMPYDEGNYNLILSESKNLLPAFILPLKIGDNLGDLDAEMIDGSGYLAGVKRYYLTDANGHVKSAIHGLPTATKSEADALIEKLATGTNAEYTGRAKPLRAKEAKNADEIGKFTRKDYEAVFTLDDRLQWEDTPDGWKGYVKPYENLKNS